MFGGGEDRKEVMIMIKWFWINLAKFCLRRAGGNAYDIDMAIGDICWDHNYGNIGSCCWHLSHKPLFPAPVVNSPPHL